MPTRDGSGPEHAELLLLWSARRTGVLDALTTTAGTPGAVADETGLDAETSERFVQALADYGYLRPVGGEYEVTNRALGFLATRDLRSIGTTPRALDLLDAAAAVGADGHGRDDGRPAAPAEHGDGSDAANAWLRHRLGAHAATPTAEIRASVTAAVHAAPDADRVVDVRGASGVYAAEFARRGRDVTLVEAPDVLAVVDPVLASTDVATVPAADVATVPIEDAELAVLVGVLRRHPPAIGRRLLRGIHDALADVGTVVVLEPLRGRSPVARRVAAERLVLGEGDVYTAETIDGWLADAGFVDCETRDVPGTATQAVVGRRERGVD
jgi:hypothetical protein